MYTSLPVLLHISNVVRWVICQFTRPSDERDAQAAPCVRSWRDAHRSAP